MHDKQLIDQMLRLVNSLSEVIVKYQKVVRDYQITLTLLLPVMNENDVKEKVKVLVDKEAKAVVQLAIEARDIQVLLSEIEAVHTNRIIH